GSRSHEAGNQCECANKRKKKLLEIHLKSPFLRCRITHLRLPGCGCAKLYLTVQQIVSKLILLRCYLRPRDSAGSLPSAVVAANASSFPVRTPFYLARSVQI